MASLLLNFVNLSLFLRQATSTSEGQNDKRNVLRELAALNGTSRDDEYQKCLNCGGVGDRKYDCPEQQNFTADIICPVCGVLHVPVCSWFAVQNGS